MKLFWATYGQVEYSLIRNENLFEKNILILNDHYKEMSV